MDETRSLLNHIVSMDVSSSPFISLLLIALDDAGCSVNPDQHVAIENCGTNVNIFGAFDSFNNQIVLCLNQFESMPSGASKSSKMQHLLSHELIHAYDHCRANVDFYSEPRQVMCSEIRAAALSGECMLSRNKTSAVFAGFKKYHQKCVRKAALNSFRVLHPDWTAEKSQALVTELFPSCYGDHSPFDRIPLTKKQAELSYKAYINRHRYSV